MNKLAVSLYRHPHFLRRANKLKISFSHAAYRPYNFVPRVIPKPFERQYSEDYADFHPGLPIFAMKCGLVVAGVAYCLTDKRNPTLNKDFLGANDSHIFKVGLIVWKSELLFSLQISVHEN